MLSGCLDRSGDRQTQKIIQDLIVGEAWEECIAKTQAIPAQTTSPEFYQQSLGLCALKFAEIQAKNNDLAAALTTLTKVPNNTKEAEQKVIYFEKWSKQVISNAQSQAAQNNYQTALKLVGLIPEKQLASIDTQISQLKSTWHQKIIQYAQSVYEKNGIEKAQGILTTLTDEKQRTNLLSTWQATDQKNAATYAQISNSFDAKKWNDVIKFYQGLSTDYWRQRSRFFVDTAQRQLAQSSTIAQTNADQDIFAVYKYRASQNSGDRSRLDAYINPKNVRYNETIQYYNVQGRNKSELTYSIISANISGEPGVHAAGLTETSIGGNWLKEYQKTGQNSSCTLKQIQLELNIIITLPKWVEYPSADTALKTDWDIFAMSVEDHEHEHKNIARRAVNNLDKKLSSIGARKDCETLDREVKTIWNQSLAEHEKLQREYDIRDGMIQI